jgi:hypothetical protein
VGLGACDEKPAYSTVPSNATHGLRTSMDRLLAAGLRVSIREFPPNPCGVGLESYHVRVQSPRAPACVRRGSTVEVKVFSSPIPSPISRVDAPEFTVVPDLVGLPYSKAMSRLEGIWPCIVEVPPLTPEASVRGFDAYVVASQHLDPGTRIPYDGVRTKEGGFRASILRIRLALGE